MLLSHARGLYKFALCITAILATIAPSHASAAGLDFLLPGISLRTVAFDSCASVSYLIISESYGIPDTSIVDLTILETSGGHAVIEVSTSPYPRSVEETVWVRMKLSEGIRSMESPEEFSCYASEILVKEGQGPFQAPSAEDLEELKLERMFLASPDDSSIVEIGMQDVVTPAGSFSCEKREMTRRESSDVSLGGVEALRIEMERTILWLSPEIPFWGLVRSRIERESSTRVTGDSSYDYRPRRSVTESILISFSKSSE
jgi:hypothetical protein